MSNTDLERTLLKHRFYKRWLVAAEEWLRSDREVVVLSTYDIRCDEHQDFRFDVPRSLWEPQLRAQVEKTRRHVTELDRIVREYVEEALKI